MRAGGRKEGGGVWGEGGHRVPLAGSQLSQPAAAAAGASGTWGVIQGGTGHATPGWRTLLASAHISSRARAHTCARICTRATGTI